MSKSKASAAKRDVCSVITFILESERDKYVETKTITNRKKEEKKSNHLSEETDGKKKKNNKRNFFIYFFLAFFFFSKKKKKKNSAVSGYGLQDVKLKKKNQ